MKATNYNKKQHGDWVFSIIVFFFSRWYLFVAFSENQTEHIQSTTQTRNHSAQRCDGIAKHGQRPIFFLLLQCKNNDSVSVKKSDKVAIFLGHWRSSCGKYTLRSMFFELHSTGICVEFSWWITWRAHEGHSPTVWWVLFSLRLFYYRLQPIQSKSKRFRLVISKWLFLLWLWPWYTWLSHFFQTLMRIVSSLRLQFACSTIIVAKKSSSPPHKKRNIIRQPSAKSFYVVIFQMNTQK